MADFIHLRTRSVYTLSQGASKIASLVDAAKALGAPAMALTDRNNLYGAGDFSKAASSAGVQPILGCELTVDLPGVARGDVLFLAANAEGYAAICGMLRAAAENAEGKDEIPVLPGDALASGGVIAICGTAPGSLMEAAAKKSSATLGQAFDSLLRLYGDSFYAEICRTELPNRDPALEEAVLGLAYGGGNAVTCADGTVRREVPIVGTCNVWYATPDRHDAWLLLRAVSGGGQAVLSSDGIVDVSSQRFYMRGPEEVAALFADVPEALGNTANIARRCAYMVKGRDPILPRFDTGEGRSEAEELKRMGREGLAARLSKAGIAGEQAQEYEERLEYELSVIEKMGFPGYFLIVADFIQWAKARDIPVGPGRGSGAGSVAAWALTITDLDPIEHGLLFERFLNPDRVSMPDFDIDFCPDRREEVISYVREKYGRDRVAAISTFGEIKSKTALSDMQRVVMSEAHGKVTFMEAKDLTKLIPGKPNAPTEPMGLEQAYQEATAFRDAIEGTPKFRGIYEQAVKVEGLVRSAGMHAAGIVIADRPIEDLVPVGFDRKSNMPVVGFNMKGTEAAGLVKFDFLGLKTLSVMAETVRHVKATTGEEIDLSAILLDEPDVMAKFASAHTTGVFQFESQGMRNTLKQMIPDRFGDLVAAVALYRPGPMDNIPEYCRRKHGQPWEAPYWEIRPQLEETYGIMVYQEQVMKISQVMAGYTLGGADLLRRAMGKKIRAEMEAQRKIFVDGATAREVPADKAEETFDLMAKFADYGFNKSHAAAYAWIAYQTMWLKTRYPAAFFAALMTYNANDAAKLSAIKDEMIALGVPLLPPDVNYSSGRFLPEASKGAGGGWGVRFGLCGIKRVSGALGELDESRETAGTFTSLEDFHARVGRVFNKGQLEKMAEAGAFESLSRNRRQAFGVLSWLMDRKDKAPAGQTDMFGGAQAVPVPSSVLDTPEWGDISNREFGALGFYVREHPIDQFVERLISAGIRRKDSFAGFMREHGIASLPKRRLCVMIDSVQVKQTKNKGIPYVEAMVSERGESFRISCYGERGERPEWTIARFQNVLETARQERSPVVFVCSLSLGDGDTVWVNGDEVHPVTAYLENVRGPMTLRLDLSRIAVGLEPEQSMREVELRKAGKNDEADEMIAAARREKGVARAARMVAHIQHASRNNPTGEMSDFRIHDETGFELAKGQLRQNAHVATMLKQLELVSLQENVGTIAAAPAAPVRQRLAA